MEQYHCTYEQRRHRSTMADVARQIITQKLSAHQALLTTDEPLRILSIGCGDGNLDLPVLQALSQHGPVEYLGVDINDVSLAAFSSQLEREGASFTGQFKAELTKQSAEDVVFGAGGQGCRDFHVVLLAHVLYYSADPVSLLRGIQRQLSPQGRAIVVHSGHRGIPEVLENIAGLETFLSAETLGQQLTEAGIEAELELVATEMDLTELLSTDLSQNGEARRLLSFCLETDLDRCDPSVMESAVEVLRARSHARGEQMVFPEDLGFLTIDARVDPVQDYYQIAEALQWDTVLREVIRSADGRARVLDLGCGTGRWLKVLGATYPTLTGPTIGAGAVRHIEYSPLDPTPHAITAISPLIEQMFTLSKCIQARAEQANLPEGHYGLIWSMHSLYGVRPEDLPGVLAKVHAALVPGGMAYFVIADAASFYVRAAQEVLGEDLFRCAEDVHASLTHLGLGYEIQHLKYVERIPADNTVELSHYLWAESIGHSYFPGSRSDDADLTHPPLPDSDWWNSHRVGEYFEFPQHVQVITVRGGQTR
jgi:SAM-dependent methyltransferase